MDRPPSIAYGPRMTFIETIPPDEATGAVAKLYDAVRADAGRVTNFARAFSLRPGVFGAWHQLNGSIKANMDQRRYELATISAARRLRSSYCMLAHGGVLAAQFLAPEDLRAVVGDHRAAGLDDVDVAIMDLAEKVVADATSVTQEDIDGLRALGLTDAEILDVILAAAARCFFSKALDALGAEPDGEYRGEFEPALLEALTVGRPLAEA